MVVTNMHAPVSLDQPENFDLLANEAHSIVEQLIRQSIIHVSETIQAGNVVEENDVVDEEYHAQRDPFLVSENRPRTQEHSTVSWPRISEFTSEQVGKEKINEYIEKEWKTSPGGHDDSWLYAIDFLERKSSEFTDLYIYRVRYSIPTRRQPIPRQTVSVYFTIDVSKIKPKNATVQVSFVFETMRTIYHPDTFRFRQNWLQHIILLKEKMANDIDF